MARCGAEVYAFYRDKDGKLSAGPWRCVRSKLHFGEHHTFAKGDVHNGYYWPGTFMFFTNLRDRAKIRKARRQGRISYNG